MLLGYACAAMVGSIALLAMAEIAQGSLERWTSIQDFALTAGLIALSVAIIGLPVTLPVILFAETDRKNASLWCLLGGLVLGLLMGSLLNWNGFRLGPMVVSIIASLSGAMTYWSITWFALPPPRSRAATNAISKSRIS